MLVVVLLYDGSNVHFLPIQDKHFSSSHFVFQRIFLWSCQFWLYDCLAIFSQDMLYNTHDQLVGVHNQNQDQDNTSLPESIHSAAHGSTTWTAKVKWTFEKSKPKVNHTLLLIYVHLGLLVFPFLSYMRFIYVYILYLSRNNRSHNVPKLTDTMKQKYIIDEHFYRIFFWFYRDEMLVAKLRCSYLCVNFNNKTEKSRGTKLVNPSLRFPPHRFIYYYCT